MKIALYSILFLGVLIIVYQLMNMLSDKKVDKRFIEILGDINDKYEKRIIEATTNNYIKKDKKTRIGQLDYLIERSGIRSIIPFFSTEILIVIMIIGGWVFFFSSKKLINNPILQLEAIYIGIALPVFILKQLEKAIFNRIDDNVLFMVDAASNFAEIKNDLIYIFSSASEYLNDPLKTLIKQFVKEVNRGQTIEKAFDNLSKKIDNIRLRNLFENLCSCSREDSDGNYKKVLSKTREVLEPYYDEKENRRSKVQEGRFGIVFILALGVLIFKVLIEVFPAITTILTTTFLGNVLVAYFGVVLIVAIQKMFSLDRFNY